MKAPKFKDFITEQKKQSYKLLVITDEPEKAKTFHTADRLKEEAEKLGWDYYLYKLSLHLHLDDEFQPEILVYYLFYPSQHTLYPMTMG